MYPHRIRLRGPWEMTPPGGETRRVLFPAAWADLALADFKGRLSLRRNFGYPGRIDAHERVWLIGEGLQVPATLQMNSQMLGDAATDRFAFDVTPCLADRNRLEVSLEIASDRHGLWDDIALEVRATAYLKDVIHVAPDRVQGLVVGECPGPLEIYVQSEGRQCGYRQVTASAEGTPFDVPLNAAAKSIRVELINVSTVWYVVEVE